MRRPPRGLKKQEYATRDFFDVWFPNLAPSEELLEGTSASRSAPQALSESAWRSFARKFRVEMKAPPARRDLELLAALSHRTDFAIGCYCADESRCHRSILWHLLEELRAQIE